jgi:hypothetical protein
MKATRNMANFLILGIWFVAGAWLTLKCLTGNTDGLSVMAGLGYWLWFAGFAALTTAAIGQVKSGVGALAIHALVFFAMILLPHSGSLSLLRLGIDLLRFA